LDVVAVLETGGLLRLVLLVDDAGRNYPVVSLVARVSMINRVRCE
jgi:hypothetical protein